MARIELIDVYQSYSNPAESFPLRFNPRDENNNSAPFALEHLNLEIPDAKTMVILGPSGCGKTTILKIIAGLIPVDSGSVRFGGYDITDSKPEVRKIGMVFQDFALYPHLTSRLNILSYFVFKRKTAELYKEAREKFDRTSELMGVELEYLLDRKPDKLSGGEKQRVAIGRCITRDPNVFLLDEPFSNLDRVLRDKYRKNLKTLLKTFKITTVYVTHDQMEAYIFADILAIMNRGVIEQVGTYKEIYNKPDSMFIAEFLNVNTFAPPVNFIDGKEVPFAPDDVFVGVRPEDISIREEAGDTGLSFIVKDMEINTLQRASYITGMINDTRVVVMSSRMDPYEPGSKLTLSFEKYHTFNKITEKRIQSVP